MTRRAFSTAEAYERWLRENPGAKRRRSRYSVMGSMGDALDEALTGRIASKHTVYKGIEFRSKLEVRFAWHLDALGEQWAYEPRVYGRRGKGYLPDFEILSSTRPTFIEVKPTVAEAPAAERKMAVIWDTSPDALLIVACEEGRTYYGAVRGGPWETWQERWAA